VTLDKGTELKEPYETYQLRRITTLCRQIPKGERAKVVEKIKAQQWLDNNGNKALIEKALKLLEKEEQV